MHGHPWRGNIRELYSTLLRASFWSQGDKITELDIESALFKSPSQTSSILDRNFDNSFSIQFVIDDVVRHYITRALEETGGNRTKAASLLGLSNYQTLSNWIKKHDVPE